jgi:hypothetical protein
MCDRGFHMGRLFVDRPRNNPAPLLIVSMSAIEQDLTDWFS